MRTSRIIFAITLAVVLTLGAFWAVKYYKTPPLTAENSVPTTSPAPLDGYGILLYQKDGEPYSGQVLTSQRVVEKGLLVKFMNYTEHESTFKLLVYQDYKQLFVSAPFFVAPGKDRFIPLDTPLTVSRDAHSLVFAIVAGADKHASDMRSSTDFYGVVARYTLKASEDVLLSGMNLNPPTAFVPAKDENFSGVLVNQDIENLDRFKLPPLEVHAKPNEVVDFVIRAGGHESEEYVAWMTVDWQQVRFLNEENTWSFRLPPKKIAYQNVRITAPDVKGKYEVCAYLVSNPWAIMSPENLRYSHIDTSYRFTLIVE